MATVELTPEPALPPPNERGNYPARELTRAVMGRDIIRSRRALGWSQAELARRAGIRPETLNRTEQAKRSPSLSTYDKRIAPWKPAKRNKRKPHAASPSERNENRYSKTTKTCKKRRFYTGKVAGD